tara:strand:+ start:1327 stop:2235 length:909 start_codon:yes stop_codon:yes gene_type:complete
LAGVLVGVFYIGSIPNPIKLDELPEHRGNTQNGELMFWAGGCASCHALVDADGDEQLLLSGGLEMSTPFGMFIVPNISPDADFGIGAWTDLNFVNAMARGLSPDNKHYYPAFPYTNYQHMTLEDLLDLKAFLDTLPSSSNNATDHQLAFPYSIRRGLGLWKRKYLEREIPALNVPSTPELERGRYLVRGPAHCGACHTPRDAFGGVLADRFLAGADSLEIEPGADTDSASRIPNITPHDDGISSWSESDIAYSLESGFDPDFDSFGGSMVHVQENMAKLPAEDRAAIAAYLKSIPAIPSDQN